MTGPEILTSGDEIRLGRTIVLHFEAPPLDRTPSGDPTMVQEDINQSHEQAVETPSLDQEPAAVSAPVIAVEPDGDVVQGDQIGGDKLSVGDISGRPVVAVGAGAKAMAVYQGLSTEDVAALLVELKRIDQPVVWDGRTPYLGLTTFRESDVQFFFGREELVDDLLGQMQSDRFIVIAGPSGSGKSSVARAGLFPALGAGRLDKSETWPLATMQPEGNPIEQLAIAMERTTKSTQVGDAIREEGFDNPAVLQRQMEMYLSDDSRQCFVLFVDQFEETFAQTKDEEERDAFINLLTTAAQAETGRIIILISLRSDFFSQCARYPQLLTLMSRQCQLVGAMAPQDLAKAITLPALEAGVEIDPALVSRIIADMKGEPGALPLMSFALRDLFEAEKTTKGEPMTLTLPEYLTRGGIESALERHANQVFDDFSDEQKALARSIFSRLIEVGQDHLVTRRTTTLQELIPAGTSKESVIMVVGVLAQEGARLITTGGVDSVAEITRETATQTSVTLAHEKLIDAWPWLRQLVEENWEIIALQNQINRDARAWRKDISSTPTLVGSSLAEVQASAGQEDHGFLYRGGRLLQVEEKLELLQPNLDDLSQRFIVASVALRKREKSEREQERQARERLRQRITVGAVSGLVITLTLAALSFSLYLRSQENAETATTNLVTATAALVLAETSEAGAVYQRNEAQQHMATATRALATSVAAQATTEAERSRARYLSQLWSAKALGSQSLSLIDMQYDLALLLSLEGVRVTANLGEAVDTGSEESLTQVVAANPRLVKYLHDHTAEVRGADFSPDGSLMVTAGLDSRIIIWDTETWQPTDQPIAAPAGVQELSFHPGGAIIATAHNDDSIVLWDVNSRQPLLPPLTGHSDRVWDVAFSPDGTALVSSGKDGAIIMWDVATGERIGDFSGGHEGSVRSIDFSPDGRFLISAADDSNIYQWDLVSQQVRMGPLKGHIDTVTSLAYSPDGQQFVSGSYDGNVVLWDATTGRALAEPLTTHEDQVWAVAFSRNGRIVASGSRDKRLILTDVNSGQPIDQPLHGHTESVRDVAVAPDDLTVATVGDDSKIILWDLVKTLETADRLVGHEDVVRDIATAPAGNILASGSDDGKILLWDNETGQIMGEPLSAHEGRIWALRFSPDGQLLASGGRDQTIRLWDVQSGLLQRELREALDSDVTGLAFSPDGSMLASGEQSGRILLWDLATGRRIGDPLTGHGDRVWQIAFSSDGRTLLSGSKDGTVLSWEVASEQTIGQPIIDYDIPAESVALHIENELAALGSEVGRISLWNTGTGDLLHDLAIEEAVSIESLAFSTDGQTLAAGSRNGGITLWDVVTGQVIRQLPEIHGGAVRSLIFTPNDQLLISGGADSELARLVMQSESGQQRACDIANRSLSEEEWEQYITSDEPYRLTCPQLPTGMSAGN